MLTIAQCAAELGLSRQRIFQLIAAGTIPAEKHLTCGREIWYIKVEVIENIKATRPPVYSGRSWK